MWERLGSGRTAWLNIYYIASPLFACADWMGFNVRAVGLADFPEWRALYYVTCTAIGAATVLRPSWSALLGVLESGVNILLLVLAVVLPYYRVIDVLSAGGTPAALPFSPEFFINFLISGTVGVTQFQGAQASLHGSR